MNFLYVTHFTSDEFDSPDLPGSGIKMNLSFIQQLDKLREQCGFIFKIHSGYRTSQHNAQVGGVSESEHTNGEGVDIEITNGVQRYLLVTKALAMGFNRIGIGDTFVHLGVSKTLPQNVIWNYPKK